MTPVIIILGSLQFINVVPIGLAGLVFDREGEIAVADRL